MTTQDASRCPEIVLPLGCHEWQKAGSIAELKTEGEWTVAELAERLPATLGAPVA